MPSEIIENRSTPEDLLQKDRWKDETALYAERIKDFFVRRNAIPLKERKRYHHMSDLHLSGGYPALLDNINSGGVVPHRVEELTMGGKITQIHVTYDGGLDVYFQNEALKDFLAQL